MRGALVGFGLIEVTFNHRDRLWRVAAYERGGKFRPGSEASGIDGLAPGGKCGGETAGMVVGDAIGNGGVGIDGIAGVCGGVGERIEIKGPEAVVKGT